MIRDTFNYQLQLTLAIVGPWLEQNGILSWFNYCKIYIGDKCRICTQFV